MATPIASAKIYAQSPDGDAGNHRLALGAPLAFWGKRVAASLILDLPVASPLPIVIAAATMIAGLEVSFEDIAQRSSNAVCG